MLYHLRKRHRVLCKLHLLPRCADMMFWILDPGSNFNTCFNFKLTYTLYKIWGSLLLLLIAMHMAGSEYLGPSTPR